MQSTQILPKVELALAKLLEEHPVIPRIVERITTASGTAYLVGGAVRDLVLGIDLHDIDIEVHGLSLEQLSDILSQEGPVSYVGKSFGVLKLHGTNTDWALPRTDTAGRKPTVMVDPHMGIYEALRRRDLTMNAMAINLATVEFVDPFNGLDDLSNKVLKSPDLQFFCEDPLRFYRVMQFIGRFEMYPDKELNEQCVRMDIAQVSVERIEYEFDKLLLKSRRPSLGIRWLATINRLHEVLPELAHSVDIEQEPEWHPEGKVFEHLMQSLDAAAQIDMGSRGNNLILCYAAMTHDLGKISTTIIKDGRIKSPGHAQAGVAYAKSLLKRITRKVKQREAVGLLVKNHMEPGGFIKQQAKLPAYKRLAFKLAKYTNIDMLANLALADQRGRNPEGPEPLAITPPFIIEFLKRAEEANALIEPEKPVLLGRDIMDLVKPGPVMGTLLNYAFEQQIEKGITSKKELKKLVIERLKGLKKKPG